MQRLRRIQDELENVHKLRWDCFSFVCHQPVLEAELGMLGELKLDSEIFRFRLGLAARAKARQPIFYAAHGSDSRKVSARPTLIRSQAMLEVTKF